MGDTFHALQCRHASAMAPKIIGISTACPKACSGESQTKYKIYITCPLWGEFADDWWIPSQMASNTESVQNPDSDSMSWSFS